MRRTRFVFTVATLLAVVPRPVAAQELPTARPADVGLSAERLNRIDDVFEAHVAEGRIAGAVGMVVRLGHVVYVEAWGKRDRESGDPMEASDLFTICSMTKPVTSVAAMMLWEEGKFSLSDPIQRWLPEFEGARVAELGEGVTTANLTTRRARRPIQVRDLLRHTAGLSYGVFSNTPVDSLYRRADPFGAPSLSDFSERVGPLPLLVDPGTRWIYSLGVDVLGRFVEVVSGMPFDDFVQARIFDPLDMRDTHFRVPAASDGRRATRYRHVGQDATLEPTPGPDGCQPAGYPAGGSGLASTARDYARFAQMMLNGGALGDARLLGSKTVELMTTDHLGDVPGPGEGTGFGLGFAVKEGVNADPTSLGTYRWGGAFGTTFWIDPAEELIGVFMIQLTANQSVDFRGQFSRLVYQAIVG